MASCLGQTVNLQIMIIDDAANFTPVTTGKGLQSPGRMRIWHVERLYTSTFCESTSYS